MDVKELKELLNNIPDNYEIRSRAGNALLYKDEDPWQFHCSGYVTKIKIIKERNAVMLIRGVE